MAREHNDRMLVLCGYLAVLAAASIVLTMQVPPPESTFASVVSGARFVGAVAAGIFGFISWFERRYPVDQRTARAATANRA
jgi:hypothetical protein